MLSIKRLAIFLAIFSTNVAVAGDVFLLKPTAKMGDIHIRALPGEDLNLDSFQGKVLFVTYWATWCSTCKEELPQLDGLRRKYAPRLEVLGVSVDDENTAPELIRKFISELGVSFPIARISKSTPTPGGVPYTVIVDDEGYVRQRHPGLVPPQVYESDLRALLALDQDTHIIPVKVAGN